MGSDNKLQELVLQRTRSSKTPIFRLPTEITVEIFKFTQSTRSYFSGTIHDSWSWITITHVCRRWRNIAISTQTLWTHIDTGLLSSTEEAKIYLERSATSKLVVREQKINSTALALECLHLVLGHIHRIRALHILNLEDAPVNIQNALQTPAPELQNLTLYMYPLSNVNTLLGGHTPKLTRLSLHANLSSWANTPIMQNLSDLNIGSSTSPLNLPETYSILKENPSIKKFRILCQTDALTPEDLRPLPIPIELPSLKYLGVSIAKYDSLSELLKNIVIPNEMNWKIFCHKYPLRRSPKAESQRIIPNFSSDSRSSGTIAISISPEYVTIEDQCCNGEVEEYNNHPSRTLKCSWDIEDQEDQMTLSVAEGFDVIRSAVKGGFWSSAKALVIDIEAKSSPMWSLNFSHYTWRKLLQSLPKLLVLNIRHVKSLNAPRRTVYESHARLLKALTYSSSGDHDSDSDKSHFICPDLKSLHLCGINLRYDLPYLVHYLSRRASNGLQLLRLELCEPYCLTDEILRCLRNIGIARDIEVVWNVHPLDDSEVDGTDFEDYDTDVDSN